MLGRYDRTNRRGRWIDLGIIFAFLILSIANVLLIWHFHRIPMKSLDMSFHWQRIGELIRSRSAWPQFATTLFSGNGSAVMTMYPYLLEYPAAFLYRGLHSVVTGSLIIFTLATFTVLLISYFSCQTVDRHRRFVSFDFAVMYSLTTFLTATGIGWYETGALDSFLFMPLVVFGMVNFFRNGHWLMLSIGMSWIVYSSVISTVITGGLLLIWLIFDHRQLDLARGVNLLRAALLTGLTTALFWLPMVKLWWLNRLNQPTAKQIVSNPLKQMIEVPLTDQASLWDALTIYSLLGIVTGLFLFRHLGSLAKRAYLFAVTVVWLSSAYFPWSWLSRTPLRVIQYTGRLLLIPQVILTYILALGIYRYSSRRFLVKSIVLVLIIMGLQLSNQGLMYHQFGVVEKRIPATNRIVSDPRYQIRIHHASAFDYYPRLALKDRRQLGLDDGEYLRRRRLVNVPFRSVGRGDFTFRSGRISRLRIPFLSYHGIAYRGRLDGHPVRLRSDSRQLLELTHVPRGRHYLRIRIRPNPAHQWGGLMTLVSLLIYAELVIRRRHES